MTDQSVICKGGVTKLIWFIPISARSSAAYRGLLMHRRGAGLHLSKSNTAVAVRRGVSAIDDWRGIDSAQMKERFMCVTWTCLRARRLGRSVYGGRFDCVDVWRYCAQARIAKPNRTHLQFVNRPDCRGVNMRAGHRGIVAGWILLPMLFLSAAAPAAAQDYPSHPVRLISDSAPGSAIDVTMRIIAERLSKVWGQQAVVIKIGRASCR